MLQAFRGTIYLVVFFLGVELDLLALLLLPPEPLAAAAVSSIPPNVSATPISAISIATIKMLDKLFTSISMSPVNDGREKLRWQSVTARTVHALRLARLEEARLRYGVD